MQKKIEKFTDLVAWQEGHKLVMLIYRETEKFPKSEIFGLSSQMRRCAVSVTSCIAEGFSRSSLKDKNYFFYISLGSVTELQNQLIIARDLKYIARGVFKITAEQSVFVHLLLCTDLNPSNLYFE